MHIIDSNFKRIIRTSHHPWKLWFTSTLIFQSIVVLPLEGINKCLWRHFVVQMVGYPAILSFHTSLTCLLCRLWSSLTAWRGEFREIGSRGRRWMQQVTKGHTHTHTPPAKLLMSIEEAWAGVPTPHSQASLLWDGPSQTDITLMGWQRDKMDQFGSAQQGKIPLGSTGMRKGSHSCCLCATFNRSCWKATKKFFSP